MWKFAELKRPDCSLPAMYVDVSPNGQFIVLGIGASSRETPAVVICAADDGRVVQELCRGRSQIAGVTYCELDGSVRAIFITSDSSRAELVRIDMASGDIQSLAVLEVGQWVGGIVRNRRGDLIASYGDKLCVWESATGNKLWARERAAEGAWMQARLNKEGTRLYEQGTQPSRVLQWNIHEDRAVKSWVAPEAFAQDIAVSPDERYLCVSARQGTGAFLYDLQTDQRVGSAWFNEHAPAGPHLFLPGGDTIVTDSAVISIPDIHMEILRDRPKGYIIGSAVAADVPRVVMTTQNGEAFWLELSRE